MLDDGAEQGRRPGGDDVRAAEEALAQLMPALERGTREYDHKRRVLAAYRAEVGGERFNLHYGLRAPRNIARCGAVCARTPPGV